MKLLNQIKLIIRANKYKNKNDKGGINFILNNVKGGDTVFDIGCHKAGYLYFMLKKCGLSGQIHAFEPQISLYQNLVQLKQSLKWDNVFVSNIALSESKGIVVLNIPVEGSKKDSPGASILNVFDKEQQTITQEIEAETLDNYCEKHNLKPNFLKIDVEGNELEVLKGGINTLKLNKPKILIESEQRHVGQEKVNQVFKLLDGLGYQGSFIIEDQIIPLKEFSFDLHQDFSKKPYSNNFVFV